MTSKSLLYNKHNTDENLYGLLASGRGSGMVQAFMATDTMESGTLVQHLTTNWIKSSDHVDLSVEVI